MSRPKKGSPAISKIKEMKLEHVHTIFIIRARKLYISAKSDFVNNKIYLLTLVEGFERPDSGIVDSFPFRGMTACSIRCLRHSVLSISSNLEQARAAFLKRRSTLHCWNVTVGFAHVEASPYITVKTQLVEKGKLYFTAARLWFSGKIIDGIQYSKGLESLAWRHNSWQIRNNVKNIITITMITFIASYILEVWK